MQNRLTSIIVGVVLVLGVGSLVYFQKQSKGYPLENSPTNTTQNYSDDESEDEEEGAVVSTPTKTPTEAPTKTPTPTTSGITLATIATHNSSTSCWSAINGNVYDLTSWIPNHPGGEQNILSLCGIDGSSKYNGQHGTSSKPARVLGGFKIGALAK